MKQVFTEAVVNVTCDVCGKSTHIEGCGQEYGTLSAHWGYGSQHDGEAYEVHLCEACFFGALASLQREHSLNSMFSEDQPDVTDEKFGLKRRDSFLD